MFVTFTSTSARDILRFPDLGVIENATGYNVRWRTAADRLHAIYQRFADGPTSFTLRFLNERVRHVVAMEAFDKRVVSGVSPFYLGAWHDRQTR